MQKQALVSRGHPNLRSCPHLPSVGRGKRVASIQRRAETSSYKSGASTVRMRELPLPGSTQTTTDLQDLRPVNRPQPAAQCANGGQALKERVAASADEARRNSNREASTSSRPSSVTFQPYDQAQLATTYRKDRTSSQRMQVNTYDVTTSVNQAAPGFTAASQAASAVADRRAESLIDTGESESPSCNL